MRRRLLTVGGCVCLLVLAVAVSISRDHSAVTDASGSADTNGQQTTPDDSGNGPLGGPQAPGGQSSDPGAPTPHGAEAPHPGAGAPSAAAAGSGPSGSSTTAGAANGGSADAAAGAHSNPAAPGSDSTTSSPGPAVPAYSAADFYHWHWSPRTRSPLSWSFTSSVPSAWRTPISTAANSWNAERRSLQYAAPGGDVRVYPAQGCGATQLDTNGVHRTSLDGPDGIVATTYSCVDATTAQAVSIQVVIDADDRWFTSNSPAAPGEYDLIGAVAHEFGHATGWEGHYAPHDPRCTSSAHPERMCPALAPGSTAWRTTGPTDSQIFGSAY